MQIILLEDVNKLGKRGQTVKVANGFARNFLFPQGLAVRADTAVQKDLELKIKALEARDDRLASAAQERGRALDATAVTIPARAASDGKLFGSVTAALVAAALSAEGHEVEARHIQMDEPFKAVGSYTVPVRLHRDVTVEVKVDVEAS